MLPNERPNDSRFPALCRKHESGASKGPDGGLLSQFLRRKQLKDSFQHIMDTSVASSAAETSTPSPLNLESVLDVQAIDRLRALDPSGNAGLIKRVVEAFDTSLTRMMAQLDDAENLPDMALVRHVSHTLKSSSASVGGMTLSKLCADIEAQARDGHVDNLQAKLESLRHEALLVLKALRGLVQTP
jgi:HPt (histidine-containing phosphotransfer) domain-containing protein